MTEIPTPPVLDVPPPILTRRGALGAAAGAVTAVALPSALASASSIPPTEPAAYTYSGQEVLSAWSPFNTDTADYTTAGGVAATNLAANLNGRLTRGGTTQSVSNLNPVDPEISTDGGRNDLTGFCDFKVRNSSNTLNLATSPYLEFSLSMSGGSTTLATFVLYSVRQMSASPTVNLAFYVSTNDFASAVLRRTAALVQAHRHLVVNLGLLQTFTNPSKVAVRVYPYATPSSPGLRLNRFSNDPAPTALVTPQDTVNTSVVGNREANGERMAAFIGTHVS